MPIPPDTTTTTTAAVPSTRTSSCLPATRKRSTRRKHPRSMLRLLLLAQTVSTAQSFLAPVVVVSHHGAAVEAQIQLGGGGIQTGTPRWPFRPRGFYSATTDHRDPSSSGGTRTATTRSLTETVVPPDISRPLPVHTFAGMVEAALYDQFFAATPSPVEHDNNQDFDDPATSINTNTNTNSSIPRVIQSWRLLEMGHEHRECVGATKLGRDMTTTQCQQHCHSYVPGLTVQEFWDPTSLDWCHKLQSKYPAILREFQSVTSDLQALQQQGNNIWAGALTDDASSYGTGWKTLVLMDRGHWDPINVNLFPITSQAVYASGVPAVEVFFASMEPHTVIQPHTDFTNFVLTSHLPLIVPYCGQNLCRLTIGDETHQWINGQLLVFDTSLQHSAVNDSDQTRYILMLRVWHPDLSPVEQAALQFTYDCLEDPDLISSDPQVRLQAQQRAEANRAFPELLKRTAVKQGFGGKTSTGGSKKRKARR